MVPFSGSAASALAVLLWLCFGLAEPCRGFASQSQSVNLIFVGDTGSGSEYQNRVKTQMERVADQITLDRVVLLGDNVYGGNKKSLFRERFLEVYQSLLSRGIPFYASLGNHDVEGCGTSPETPLPRDASAYVDSARCWAHEQLAIPEFGYPDRFRYYSAASPGDPPLVDVFLLDSNTLGGQGGGSRAEGEVADAAQLEWLKSALEASDATWKILAFHHPAHSPKGKRLFGLGHEADHELRNQLETIIVGKVDAVFQGHNHLYARMHPRNGIRYFVSGGGGKKPYRFNLDDDTVPRPQDDGKFSHFVLVRATRESLSYCAIDDDFGVRDGGWFRKGDAADTLFAPAECPILTSQPPHGRENKQGATQDLGSSES